MNSEPNPNAQMPAGKARHATSAVLDERSKGNEGICEVSVGLPNASAAWRRDC